MLTIEKTVHSLNKSEQNEHTLLSDTVILGDLLRALEDQLQSKGLLPPFTGQFHPLWFLAETERNTFLWRRGLSLTQLEDFEFWIDVPLLISKRLEQLCAKEDEPPTSEEHRYLQMLQEFLAQTSGHIHALSQVGSKIREEIGMSKKRVVLPAAR